MSAPLGFSRPTLGGVLYPTPVLETPCRQLCPVDQSGFKAVNVFSTTALSIFVISVGTILGASSTDRLPTDNYM